MFARAGALGLISENTCVNGATQVVTAMVVRWLNRSGVAAFSTMLVAVLPVPTFTISALTPVSTWM